MGHEHLVPHNWSPIDWSLWTNGSSGQMVPLDKWSLTNLVPLDKWSLEYYNCPEGRAAGIQNMGTKLVGDHLPRGEQKFLDHLSMETELVEVRLSRGINFMGIVCPGGSTL